jgi:hypothetical protein
MGFSEYFHAIMAYDYQKVSINQDNMAYIIEDRTIWNDLK